MNVTVENGTLNNFEIEQYVTHIRNKNPGRTIKAVNIDLDGDFVNVTYTLEPVNFERIRRITGYLVGTLDRFNDAKRAEERDRVKHGLSV